MKCHTFVGEQDVLRVQIRKVGGKPVPGCNDMESSREILFYMWLVTGKSS